MIDFGGDLDGCRVIFEVFLLVLCERSPQNAAFDVLTIIHLFPSNSLLGDFFARILSGFGFFPGGVGDLPRSEVWLLLRAGTGACVRKDGFL